MDKEKETVIPRKTAVEKFREEIKELKPRLPKNWKLRFIKDHPEYDSYGGGNILHGVMNGHGTDMVVLEGVKKIVEDYENEKKVNP